MLQVAELYDVRFTTSEGQRVWLKVRVQAMDGLLAVLNFNNVVSVRYVLQRPPDPPLAQAVATTGTAYHTAPDAPVDVIGNTP